MLPKYPIKAQNATNTESTDVAVFIVPDGAISGNVVDISAGGGVAIGDTITDATEGSVLFAGAAGVLAQNNTAFKWVNADKQLVITGNTEPQIKLLSGEFSRGISIGGDWAGSGSSVYAIDVLAAGTNFYIANDFGTVTIRTNYGSSNWVMDTTGMVTQTALGAAVTPLRLKLAGSQTADAFQVYASDGTTKLWNIGATGFMETIEITAPSAPSANGVRLYAQDNGAGKTQLMALFATGVAQQIAIEP